MEQRSHGNLMTNPSDATLAPAIAAVAAKIHKFRDRPLGEQNTKASLIEPVLEALGWDIRDPDEVHREFRHTSKDSPVDYALKINRIPQLFSRPRAWGRTSPTTAGLRRCWGTPRWPGRPGAC